MSIGKHQASGQASHGPASHAGGSSLTKHHVSPLWVYYGVFVVLLFLTIVTVAVSYAALPMPYSIIVAMIVAIVKATLVAAIFMHLNFDEPFNRLVFVGSLLFLGLFFFFTFADITTRGQINPEERTPIPSASMRKGSPEAHKTEGHGQEHAK